MRIVRACVPAQLRFACLYRCSNVCECALAKCSPRPLLASSPAVDAANGCTAGCGRLNGGLSCGRSPTNPPFIQHAMFIKSATQLAATVDRRLAFGPSCHPQNRPMLLRMFVGGPTDRLVRLAPGRIRCKIASAGANCEGLLAH